MHRSPRWRWCAALYLASCAAMAQAEMPSYAQVRSSYQPSDVRILSREGEWLQSLRVEMEVRRGAWMTLEHISPALRLALLAGEDQRFYAHSGVDWLAVSAAAWGNVWNQRTRGASTITMQLAGLLDEQWRSSSQGRSWRQKLGQAWAATQMERHWRKDEILEAYLNLLPFRGELVGIDALSRSLFGKAPHGLDAVESAIASALVRGPNASAAVVARRACDIWRSMAQWQVATGDCTAIEWRTPQALQSRQWRAAEGIAPHWARYAQASAMGPELRDASSVRTTVSATLQRAAQASLQRHLRELQGRNVQDGAVVVLDNATGQVLAWVGSSGSLSQAQDVDGVRALRQPGSTLKPFLYAQAIGERRLTAASLLQDAPAQLDTAAGLYIPQNYDRSFKGWVSVRMALAASLNVPAVRTLVMATPQEFHAQLQQLGLQLRHDAGHYGYSLALGSAEVSLLALTNAYRALANQGLWSPVAGPWLEAGADAGTGDAMAAARQAVPAAAAFIVGDILADPQARGATFGWDSVLATRFWSAVKTGTSKDMRDNWAVGWSQHYTVGVWVGNASGQAMHGVSGSSGAAPIWADVMAFLHAQQRSVAPQPPGDLVRQRVQFDSQGQQAWMEPARQEWFMVGTEQSVFALAAPDALQRPRILSPVSGTVLALDPDIPPQHQQLVLRATQAGLRWRIDGQWVGRGQELRWLPLPGQHVVQLVDARLQVLDEVHLQVRGAGRK